VDAHDGSAVQGATLTIIVPAFPGAHDSSAGVAAETTTDQAGQFSLGAASFRREAVLRVRAPWHTALEQPLPPPSELAIPMIARRRHLLERLVHWAAREWGPWHGVREPTPEQVALRAGPSAEHDAEAAEQIEGVRAWARAVEETSFGRTPVDEQAERAVMSLEPRFRRRAKGRAE